MNPWFTFLILSLVVYFLTHLVVMDTLFERTRDKVLDRLTTGPPTGGEEPIVIDKHRDPKAWRALPLWRTKVFDLFTCPFCFSVWVAFGTVIAWDVVLDHSVPVPLFYALALSRAALVWWAVIDGTED
jgi:hypothetical protein